MEAHIEPLRPRSVEAFLGIPYAIPPVGDRRFRPTQLLPPSPDSVTDASKFGPAAPGKQLIPGGPKLVYSEDCLTVNVFRQAGSVSSGDDKLLPVALYVHGGAFNRGTSCQHNTSSMVAWSEEPFVAVSFNYRIGALGFLPSGLSAKEGVLNLGLKDQALLFEWVQENIKAFGGDPDNVTLFGLSAGAHSIGHHLMHFKEGVKPLFNRVIIESGASTSRAVRPYDAPVHETQFKDFLSAVGVPADLPEDEIFSFLRSLPSEVVQDAQISVFDKYNPSLQWAFQPVIDGEVIPCPPLDTWRQGKWHKVPIMTGFQRNEGSLYVDKAMSQSHEFVDFFRTLLPLLSEEDLQTIDALYPDPATVPDSPYKEERDGVGAQYKRIEAAYGHYAYVAPVRQTAEWAADDVPVFLYQWAAISTVLNGAQHGDNMRYEVCDPKVMGISENQAQLARTINSYVTNFITKGDPNAGSGDDTISKPVWHRYHKEAPKALVFGLGNKELIGGDLGKAATCAEDSWGRKESEFWWSKTDLSQQ
ncbi:alpha/beta-hydrolase [Cryphonectria parasitica EP155]|uniref:Carboxylic ester hydrolase n=1 Tax=Cryphonectria parasitica (strain ATCC 38755 / EP155) TaxID=660469 RepID=A0A9P4Y079_CRYP1|nr:alpha/beta-hydrolase [Cryphonectria parasitica EP155]KAF3764161.1 alpha/beta-hydrolase [Cryphonectria parasitica EP155]